MRRNAWRRGRRGSRGSRCFRGEGRFVPFCHRQAAFWRLHGLGPQPCLFGDLCEKPRADFFIIMERKRIVGPPGPLEPAMRTLLPCDLPSNAQQGSQQLLRLDRSPIAHATEKTLGDGSGNLSPCSIQSAATRTAIACPEAIADSRVAPYAITPGIDSISAHQRPSSSNPTTIGMDSTVILSIDLPLYYRAGASIELSLMPVA